MKGQQMETAAERKMEDVMQLSDSVNRIGISQTLAVLQEAERYKARGIDVADFGPGEPISPRPNTSSARPSSIGRESHQVHTGCRCRSVAAGDLRLARSQFGSSFQPAECIACSGGKHAIFNAICSLVNPGDEVMIPAPYWVSYPDMVKYAGGTPVFLQTRADDGFFLRAAELEKVLTSRTRLVMRIHRTIRRER